MGGGHIEGMFTNLPLSNVYKAVNDNVNARAKKTYEKDPDKRIEGKPGEVIVTSFDDGRTVRLTEIGKDGRAIRERDVTDHDSPKKHSNPHDHMIIWGKDGKWERGDIINYWDGNAPKLGKERK